ncbi:hypothetical protein [Methylocystis sp. B8]|uniref:hypothetical protein n=1 Tax=Methylocystis sp. B8 TaxID=544938 RepID=UPI0010FD16D4|nr:hypothetical protein [Methylocystis sp. B8]TLG77789.1 hypothetical protein FEV16_08165 [Methylocystis sp. B8]
MNRPATIIVSLMYIFVLCASAAANEATPALVVDCVLNPESDQRSDAPLCKMRCWHSASHTREFNFRHLEFYQVAGSIDLLIVLYKSREIPVPRAGEPIKSGFDGYMYLTIGANTQCEYYAGSFNLSGINVGTPIARRIGGETLPAPK